MRISFEKFNLSLKKLFFESKFPDYLIYGTFLNYWANTL